jgi:shikimate O-hydroxycinnamoyltransferase
MARMTTIPLSPIDLVFTGAGAYPLEFVFAYACPLDVDRLAESLARTLELFPPATSRLVRLSGQSYGLLPSREGCAFEVTTSTAAFADEGARYGFLSPVDTAEGEPLTRIKLSRTPEGPVLGVSMSHAVVDGFSFFYFLSSWARVFHGRPVPPPSHRRELLMPTPAPLGPPLRPADVLDGCGLFWGEERPAIQRDRLRWHRQVLSRSELSALLAKAQEECGVRLSHNDVIAAWLWQSHLPGWAEGAGDATAYVNCPVDARRLLPGFPTTYFGCAVVLATAEVERERLPQASLGELALRVRRAVAAVDAEGMRRSLATIDRLRQQEGLRALEQCHVVHPRCGLLVTNLSRLPAREIEFDGGPPVAFDILTPAERCAVVLPAVDGVDVRICLPAG